MIDVEPYKEQTNPGSTDKPKYRTRYRATIGIIEGYGNNATEARENALYKAEHALWPSETSPKVISWRGHMIVVYRMPNGDWSYDIQHETTPPATAFGYSSRESAEGAARHHLAQIGWDGLETTSKIITNQEDQRDFTSWARWQMEYAAAKDRGLTDEQARLEANLAQH